MFASHHCGPGSIPKLGVTCGLSLLVVLDLALRGFLQVLPSSSFHRTAFSIPSWNSNLNFELKTVDDSAHMKHYLLWKFQFCDSYPCVLFIFRNHDWFKKDLPVYLFPSSCLESDMVDQECLALVCEVSNFPWNISFQKKLKEFFH